MAKCAANTSSPRPRFGLATRATYGFGVSASLYNLRALADRNRQMTRRKALGCRTLLGRCA